MDLYQQIFFTTLALSFGILHFILYWCNPRFKSNLFFSIFLFLYALTIFFDYQVFLVDQKHSLFYLKLHRAVMPYNSLFVLLFLYYAFDFKIRGYFWILAVALATTGFFAIINPTEYFIFVQIPLVIAIAEVVRVLVSAIKKNKNDAWIIASGFILLSLFSSYDLLMDMNMISSVAGIHNGYPSGFLGLIICASIYLARDFARANETILRKEIEAGEMKIAQKILKAEDNRKAKELQEARDVQLSLLPKCITDLQDFEFCFEMIPATEVGGDYYDYLVSAEGEISLVIGDATSHGMKAGMMVSIMKSLFLSHIENLGIREFLNHCSGTIKQMKLKNLFMALMVVKIRGNRLKVSSAGIPPLLIYRRKSGEIDEIKIKGMPLGAFTSFRYEIVETELHNGDIVLMMTDGLPELFNSERETFDFEKVKQILLKSAGENKPVNKIVDDLFTAGKKWRGDMQQNDDITFLSYRYLGSA